jgi:hypothetical protein
MAKRKTSFCPAGRAGVGVLISWAKDPAHTNVKQATKKNLAIVVFILK